MSLRSQVNNCRPARQCSRSVFEEVRPERRVCQLSSQVGLSADKHQMSRRDYDQTINRTHRVQSSAVRPGVLLGTNLFLMRGTRIALRSGTPCMSASTVKNLRVGTEDCYSLSACCGMVWIFTFSWLDISSKIRFRSCQRRKQGVEAGLQVSENLTLTCTRRISEISATYH